MAPEEGAVCGEAVAMRHPNSSKWVSEVFLSLTPGCNLYLLLPQRAETRTHLLPPLSCFLSLATPPFSPSHCIFLLPPPSSSSLLLPFLHGSAQLLSFSHHRPLTNILPHKALLTRCLLCCYANLELAEDAQGRVDVHVCVSLCVCISSNKDQYHYKVTLKFN